MTTPRPLNLPKYVFLMSNDDASRRIAVDVANMMASMDNTVFIDDFTAPIYEAFRTMFDKDIRLDYGSPKSTQALMLEAQTGELTEAECIVKLEGWFSTTFDKLTLGRMALKRALDQQSITEYIYVFRDGTANHIIPFIMSREVSLKQCLTVWLNRPAKTNDIDRCVMWSEIPSDPAQIISDMEAAV